MATALEHLNEFLDPDIMSRNVGGRVDFQRMPAGTWIVPEWWIRMPIMARQTDFEGRQRPYIASYHQTGGMVLEVREAGGRVRSLMPRRRSLEDLLVADMEKERAR